MYSVFSAKEVLEIDSCCESQYGIPPLILMEHAARSCMELFLQYCRQERANIIILAGGGNNGGDAYAVARQLVLRTHHRICIVSIGKPKSVLCKTEADICKALGIRIIPADNSAIVIAHIRHADWIIDGICGVGIKTALRENLHIYIHAVNTSRAQVFSIDIPSGLYDDYKSGDVAIRAHYTATIELYKSMCYYAHTRLLCGRILNAHAGFPPSLYSTLRKNRKNTVNTPRPSVHLAVDSDIASLLPHVTSDSYKNSRGILGIYAGKSGMAGAAILATQAALSLNTGKVHLFCDSSISNIAYSVPSALVQALDTGNHHSALPLHAILAGCGWGKEHRTELLSALLNSPHPLVLDADALMIIAEKPKFQKKLYARETPTVLTPHPGEAAALLKTSSKVVLNDSFGAARKLVEHFHAIVVLKSHVPLIADKEQLVIVDGMNPALATAGSGDVLAGIIAALMAQGLSPFSAACCGSLIHQRAGRQLSKTGKSGSYALIDVIQNVLRHSTP